MVTIHVHACFVAADGRPVSGPSWQARLFDEDRVSDDLLAEAGLDTEGRAAFMFDLSKASSFDSPHEEEPDLYVVLLRDGQEVYRGPVLENVKVLRENPATGFRDGTTVDLGTHVVHAA
jgi:hypothetical protein